MLTGHLTHTLLVAVGVAAHVARAPTLLTGLTIAGAAYLVWLGVATLRRPAATPADVGTPIGSRWVWAVRGWGISGLNPKVFLLFLALLPQFARATAAWPVPAQLLVLGVVHTASCAVVYTLVAVTAGRVLRARPAAARLVSRVSGIVMIALGVVLVVEQLAT
jgi:threonine/homoserine/homoserine lactone efflux protein